MRSDTEQVIVSAVAPAFTWVLLAASLVVGLAALVRMAGPEGGIVDDVAGTIRLAPWLTSTVGTLFVVAALVFLAGLARRLRSRRHGEGEDALVPEAAVVPAWLRTLRQILSLSYFLVFAYLVWRGVIPLADMIAMIQGVGAGGAGAPPAEAAGPAPPLMTWTFGVLALAAALGALALALWVAVGDRLTGWWDRESDENASLPPLAEAVAESLEDLRSEPDARRAIVRCYARFERVTAESGVARPPWLTPMEFMREALSRLPVPRGAVAVLTGLFELARFSDRALGRPERDRALAALDEIRDALEARRADAVAR